MEELRFVNAGLKHAVCANHVIAVLNPRTMTSRE